MMSACSAADLAASFTVTANSSVRGARRFFMGFDPSYWRQSIVRPLDADGVVVADDGLEHRGCESCPAMDVAADAAPSRPPIAVARSMMKAAEVPAAVHSL
jgi:hypothetical protein